MSALAILGHDWRVPALLRLGALLTVTALFQGIGTAPAQAASLPDDLLRAAAAMPVTDGIRKRCSEIRTGFTDGSPARDLVPPGGPEQYTADTRGIYLAHIDAGISAGPFIQALLDAGAAKRLRLVRVTHDTIPNNSVALLPRDLITPGPAANAPPPPATLPRDTVSRTDVFVLQGPDARFFEQRGPKPMADVPVPFDDHGTIPRGLSTASHLCWTITPQRVLEYADDEATVSGTRLAAASILFRAESLPSWIADPRVIDAVFPYAAPREVLTLLFRDDGDGWRVQGPAGTAWDEKRWHIVDATR